MEGNMGKINVVVYMSNAGHTRRYAELLAKETGLAVYELKEASKAVAKGSCIVYMGWLLGGSIKGYKEAKAKYDIKAVCAVGMAPNGSQINDVYKMNSIAEGTQVFTLQGGFDNESLHGIYKLMMGFAAEGEEKPAKKTPAKKKHLSEEDRQMLEMFANGKDSVSVENLAPVLAWYKTYTEA